MICWNCWICLSALNLDPLRQESENVSHHVILGPLWENVVARITIDDETGHIMSLEYTKHMTEKDLHRDLPSVRDIPTVLLHFSPVTPNQQLKQSFQTFAALPVDETTQQTLQIRTAVHKELSVASRRPWVIAKDSFKSLICQLVSLDDAAVDPWMKATRYGRVDVAEVCCTSGSLLSGAVTSLGVQSLEWLRSHHKGRDRQIEIGSCRELCGWLLLVPHNVQSRSRFHRVQMNSLAVFLWFVKQDWCEAILEQMWWSTSLGRGGVFPELKEQFTVADHLDVSGVASLMECFLQNPGCSSAHIDVGQICCVLDDVFMITLIKRWRRKRCDTHRSWSRLLQKRSWEWNPRNKFVHRLVVQWLSGHSRRCSSSTQWRRTASFGPGHWGRTRNSQNHSVSFARWTWPFWSSRSDRFSSKETRTQTHHCCCQKSSVAVLVKKVRDEAYVQWLLEFFMNVARVFKLTNSSGSIQRLTYTCWEPSWWMLEVVLPPWTSTESWTLNMGWATWHVKSCWPHCWIIGSSTTANQTLSEPIQKELFDIKGFDVVWLPRAYVSTSILGKRPGKQEFLGKPLIQSNSQQFVWLEGLLTVSRFKKSLMSALQLTMTYIETVDSLRGSGCWEQHRRT